MLRALFVLMIVVFGALAWRVWQGGRAESAKALRGEKSANAGGGSTKNGSSTHAPAASKPPASPAARIFAGGFVEGARRDLDVRSELTGRIAVVHCSEGDEVQTGDLLAELEPDLLDLALTESKAQLTIAVAERDRVAAQQTAARTSRATAPTEDGAVRPAAATMSSNASSAEMTIAESRVTLAQAAVRRATLGRAKARLLAPADGVVLRVRAAPGELAGPTDPSPLFTIIDGRSMRVRAFVEEHDALDVAPGQKVAVSAVGRPDRSYVGEVVQCAPGLQPKSRLIHKPGERHDVQVREILISLDDGTGLLPGLPVELFVQRGAVRK